MRLLHTGLGLAPVPQVPAKRSGSGPVRTTFTKKVLAVGLDGPLKGDLRPVGGARDLLLSVGEALSEFGLPHFRTILSGLAAVFFKRALGRFRAGLKRRRQLKPAIEADAKRVVQCRAGHGRIIRGADLLLLHRS